MSESVNVLELRIKIMNSSQDVLMHEVSIWGSNGGENEVRV